MVLSSCLLKTGKSRQTSIHVLPALRETNGFLSNMVPFWCSNCATNHLNFQSRCRMAKSVEGYVSRFETIELATTIQILVACFLIDHTAVCCGFQWS